MTRQTLLTSLEKLHEQLGSPTPALDADTRTLLREVAEDIEVLLAQSDPDPASVRDRLEQAAVRFEASHPQLAQTLTQITDALAKLGV
jgi:hypothetical protein